MPNAVRVSEKRFRALWADRSLSKADIGRLLGCTGVTVWRMAKEFGLPPRPHSGGRVIDVAVVRAMWDQGMTAPQIAARMGRTQPTIESIIKRNGFPPHGRGHAPKLTVDARFRAMWAARVPLAEMALAYGVTQTTIMATAKRGGLPARVAAYAVAVDDRFRSMWAAGVMLVGMAAAFGVDVKSIKAAADRAGLPRRVRGSGPRITLAEWQSCQAQDRLREAMAVSAAIERRALRMAEMVDVVMSPAGKAAVQAARMQREMGRAA